jgi:hypothetical protein
MRQCVLWAAVLGLCAGQGSAAVFNDGLTHTISDSSYAGGGVRVEDSASGATTTVTIVEPAHIGATVGPKLSPDDSDSLEARATHGGHAVGKVLGGVLDGSVVAMNSSCISIVDGVIGTADLSNQSVFAGSLNDLAFVDISGGTLLGGVHAQNHSRVIISGGSFGHDLGNSVSTGSSSSVTRVDISDGIFAGGVSGGDHSRITISGGSFGDPSGTSSVQAAGSSGVSRVDISKGTFDGGVSGGSGARITISGGTFGGGSGSSSVYAAGSSDFSTVGISGGTFDGQVSVGSRGQVTISSGSFGAGFGGNWSVDVAGTTGIGAANISGGTFPGNVSARTNGRVRLSGGSFGTSTFSGNSVSAWASAGKTSVVEIFGGAFSGDLEAGPNGTIHVYGQGLNIAAGVLTGTLADGAPINTGATTSGNGEIVLHESAIPIIIPGGYMPLVTGSGARLQIPHFSLPPAPLPCQSPALFVDMLGESLNTIKIGANDVNVGMTDTIIRRLDEATSFGGASQDTIAIEMVALQLRSIDPVDLSQVGLQGTGELFLTLQSNRGPGEPVGTASTGEMTIDFAMRQYDSSLEVFYDMRLGGLDAPILFSGSDTLVSQSVLWSDQPPEDSLLLQGFNDGFTPGVVGGSLFHFPQEGQFFSLGAAPTPEPAAFTLYGVMLFCLNLRRHRRKGMAL